MANSVGETVRVRARALDPETRAQVDPEPLAAVVEFWEPGRNPRRDPTVRDTPAVGPVPMTYKAGEQVFEVFQPTVGDPWVPGRWFYRVTVTASGYTNWEYGSIKLRA